MTHKPVFSSAAKPLYVTQPSLPTFELFASYLGEIWDSAILTNNGAMHRRLEAALRARLGVEHIALFSSGTTALLVALKALELNGEVITTPFTFSATTHVLAWSGLTPVFADIDARTMNLDPASIERAITPQTSAILPVHCYGQPCDVAAIADIARRHGLRVIYDAAHAFDVADAHGSLMRHGDLSVLSFHATKVFSTVEGGAVVCRDAAMLERINLLKNFGILDEVTVAQIGINGKLNEISAAFGLAQLEVLDQAREARQRIDHAYRTALVEVRGIRLIPRPEGFTTNHGYFPVLIDDDYPLDRDRLYGALRAAGINSRRYFYPLTSNFPMYAALPSAHPGNLPVANDVAQRILCLPIHAGLTTEDVERVAEVIQNHGRQQ